MVAQSLVDTEKEANCSLDFFRDGTIAEGQASYNEHITCYLAKNPHCGTAAANAHVLAERYTSVRTIVCRVDDARREVVTSGGTSEEASSR
mgnify:CR=1 FL=1